MADDSNKSGEEASAPDPVVTLADVFKACQLGHLEDIRRYVSDGFDIHNKDGEGITCLHWAAINAREAVVDFLLDQGADVNALGGELQSTPVYWATSQGHMTMVVQLLKRDADPAVSDANGHNCLFLSAQLENWKMLTLFSSYHVHVDSVDNEGLTPLLWVCQHRANRKDLIRVLLALGASTSLTEPKHGHAALHCAVTGRAYLSTIRALLVGGADITQKNTAGETPTMLAETMGSSYQYVARELEAQSNTPLCGFFMMFAIPWFTIPAVFGMAALLTWLQFIITITIIIIMACVLGNQTGNMLGCHDDRRASIAQSAISSGVNTASVFWIGVPFFMHYWTHISAVTSVVFMTAYFSIWFCLYRVCTVSSVIPQARWSLERRLEKIKILAERGKLGSVELCPTNLVQMPLRAKFCSVQRLVVSRFDHHCPFVNNTVGAKNHKYFIGFLISAVTSISMWLVISCVYFMAHVSGDDGFFIMVYNVFAYDGFSASCFVLALFHLIWITGLLFFQLMLVKNGVTTYEHLCHYGTSQYDQGAVQNFVDFFEVDIPGYKKSGVDWDNCYQWPPTRPSDALLSEEQDLEENDQNV